MTPRPLFLALGLAALMAGSAAAGTLTILHTNDFHSRIEPVNRFASACSAEDDAAGKCFGGSARLLTAIRAARAEAQVSILVDAGDQFQGSLFYTHYQGLAAAEMMTALGYDAMAVGNHEFDDGPEVLRGFVDAVGFPVLMANADVSAEPALAGAVMPSAVIERGGHRIGLIGLAPADTPDIASPGPGVVFEDPIEAVRREVARLSAAGIDRIVVLSHAGHATDLRMAAAVDGIDVIVGGHSHTLLSNTDPAAAGPYPVWATAPGGGRTAIVQAGAYGTHLGRLEVTFDGAGAVVGAVGDPVPMDASVPEDAALKARIAALAVPLDEVRNRVVAEAAAPIDGGRDTCRSAECQMGTLVAEAMLDRVRAQGISIAIQNGGGLRASIDAGPVTMGEVLTVLPFRNALSTFVLTGADIVAALEHGVSGVEEGLGRFPQVAGLRYAFTRSVPPGTGRITRVEVRAGDGWAPIDPAARYGVVSNDFMRRGGDGYAMFAERASDAYDFGPGLEDVVAAWLAAQGVYTPATDGRIVEE